MTGRDTKPRKLPDVAFFQEGPGLRNWQWTDDGMKVINGTNILPDGSIDISNTDKFISQDEFDSRYRHFGIDDGDIVLSSSGTLGKVGRIGAEHLPLMMNTSVIRLRAKDPSVLDDGYLFAFLRSPQFQASIRSFAVGGVQQNFGPSHLKRVELSVPHIRDQHRIANILSAYDELIDNNRRRMTLLEDGALQLYREWFVRLRFPGHEHGAITNGVPERWERRPLSSCVIFRSGGTPSKDRMEYWDGDIPWVSSGEMSETRLYDTPLHVSPEGAEAGSRLVSPDTILIVVRGMSLAKEFRLATVSREMAFNQDLKALECRDGIDSTFLFHSLLNRRDGIRELATEASHGTKKLDTPVLERIPILVAEPRLQRLFRDTITSSLAQRDNLHHQNVRLRTARDLLLPRLMSGEIVV